MTHNPINYSKNNGLVPSIIQHHKTGTVLMLGFMNEKALKKTHETGRVTFFSRTKQRLWTKGETSGNYLEVVDMQIDCDDDTLLVLAKPHGPTCHTGNESCFFKKDFSFSSKRGNEHDFEFLSHLQELIATRKEEMPEGSYTTSLFSEGIDKIAQKVGEEAVESVIASKNSDDKEVIYETADLLYHVMVLLTERGLSLDDIVGELKSRHN